jgi:general stress protein YciG
MAKSKGQMTVQEAGRKGGQTTSREHGPEFYHEIGTKGGRRVRELIEAGKKTESGSKRGSGGVSRKSRRTLVVRSYK